MVSTCPMLVPCMQWPWSHWYITCRVRWRVYFRMQGCFQTRALSKLLQCCTESRWDMASLALCSECMGSEPLTSLTGLPRSFVILRADWDESRYDSHGWWRSHVWIGLNCCGLRKGDREKSRRGGIEWGPLDCLEINAVDLTSIGGIKSIFPWCEGWRGALTSETSVWVKDLD